MSLGKEQSLCAGLCICSGGWGNSVCNLIFSECKPLTEQAGSLAGACSRVIMAPGCRALQNCNLDSPMEPEGQD